MSSEHRWSPVVAPPRRLTRPVPADPRGVVGPTPNQARGPRWRRTTPGLFVPAGVTDELPEQRILEQSMLLPPDGAVTGWAALRMAGAGFFDGLGRDGRTRLDVDLVVGPDRPRRARPGIAWHRDRLGTEEVWTRQGVPCTRPERAVFDAMRWADLRAAVEHLDMAAAAELVSIRRIRRYTGTRARWDGVPLVRRALDLADENSASPAETRLRLCWVLDAGCPRPLANRDVFDGTGRRLGVADLIDDRAGVVGEFDGGEHARARRRSRDAARDSAFRDAGLEVFRVTGYDEHYTSVVVERVRAAYARAATSTRQRRWTLTPPPGWRVALSVDDVLDQQDWLRQLHEA